MKSVMFIGALIVFTGAFWLLSNLGYISADFWEVFWPLVVILIGLKILLVPLKWYRFWDNLRGGKKRVKIE